MEKFQSLRQESLKKYRVADHILNVTYPLLKDTKLLLGVTDNLFLALTTAMSSVLYHERIFKLVPFFEDSFESKFNVFRHRCVPRHKINSEYIDLIQDLQEIISLHKKSPIEFRRKDRFIICNKNYQMRGITTNQLKTYLQKTKEFLKITQDITSSKERFFNNQ